MFLTVIIFVTNVYHLEIYVILLFIIGFLKCFILKFYSKNTFFFFACTGLYILNAGMDSSKRHHNQGIEWFHCSENFLLCPFASSLSSHPLVASKL